MPGSINGGWETSKQKPEKSTKSNGNCFGLRDEACDDEGGEGVESDEQGEHWLGGGLRGQKSEGVCSWRTP